MSYISISLIGLVALLHAFFLILEMFLWDKPLGCKIFRHNAERAKTCKTLAQNQGLYNGILSAGLIFGLIASNQPLIIFILMSIIIAGIFGAWSVNKNIFYVQSLPAILAMLTLFI